MKKLNMFNERHRRFLLFKPAGVDIRYVLAHTKIFKNYLGEGVHAHTNMLSGMTIKIISHKFT